MSIPSISSNPIPLILTCPIQFHHPILFHPIPSHPIPSHPTPSHPKLPYLVLHHLISSHVISSHPSILTPPDPVPSHLFSSRPISYNLHLFNPIHPNPPHLISAVSIVPCHTTPSCPSNRTHLSQCRPVVWSRQRRQLPVRGSHSSACPLHWQGRQVGKPQWPGWQRSHCRPTVPGWHRHCPLPASHSRDTEPSGEQAQAAEWHGSRQGDLKPENSHPSGMGRQADRQRDPTPACLTHQQTLLLTAAPQGSEAIAAGCAAVTAAAEDVGLALTLPGQHLAHAAVGALRVALAGCGAAGDERPTHSQPLIPAAPDSRRAPSCSMAETLQIRRAQASARACGGAIWKASRHR